MKKKFFLRFLTILFSFFSLFVSARAAPVEPQKAQDFINKTGYRLIEALGNKNLNQKYTALDKLFSQNVDIPYLARFVLGKYWHRLTPNQKKTYLNLFPRYVIGIYKSYPLNFGTEGLSFEILSTLPAQNFTDVFCRVNLPESLRTEHLPYIDISFKLEKIESGIKIVDLKIGESSLLVSYRNRFYQLISDADEDMDWFLEDFADLTNAAEKSAEEKLLSH